MIKETENLLVTKPVTEILDTQETISDTIQTRFDRHREINCMFELIRSHVTTEKLCVLYKTNRTLFNDYFMHLSHIQDLIHIAEVMEYTTISTTLHLEIIYNNLYESTYNNLNKFINIFKEGSNNE